MPSAPPDETPPTRPHVTDDEPLAPPPPMPVQSALYIAPDGSVSFGALFAELVPVAKALDPAFDPTSPPPPDTRR